MVWVFSLYRVNSWHFCLVAYAFQEGFEENQAKQIMESYFPYIRGLHILLDYLIDQEEDKQGGDLNFCSYYSSEEVMIKRLEYFVEKADTHLKGFHMRIFIAWLIGDYLEFIYQMIRLHQGKS